MNPIYVPLLSALGGAIVGSVSSLTALFIQTKMTMRAERLKQAVQLAIEDHRVAFEFAKSHAGRGAINVPPIVSYLHYHTEILEASSKGPLTKETLRSIRAKGKELLEFADEIAADRKKARDTPVET